MTKRAILQQQTYRAKPGQYDTGREKDVQAALDLVADDFEAVIDAERTLLRAQQSQHASVIAARKVGTSWASIGEIFGISRQAAQQRFGA